LACRFLKRPPRRTAAISTKDRSMNSPVCGLRVAGILTGLGCLAHLVRLLRPFQVMIGSHSVPVWANGVGFVVLGLLSFWFWKLSVAAKPAEPVKPAAA
jgi:hypothetical protein